MKHRLLKSVFVWLLLAASIVASDLRYFGNTSNIVRFRLTNSTTGQGLTGLTSASSGLIISTVCDNEATATNYTVAGSTIESITTLGTFAAPTATKVRFKEVDATNQPGLYEFQIADARFAVASSRRMVIGVTGATNLQDAAYEIQLLQVNPYDGVRLGMTALPNAAVDTIAGLQTGRQGPRTWYISSVGNDSNSGLDQTAPLLTTAQALTNYSNGDTIVLLNSITTASFAPSKQVTLQGAKATTAIALTISGGGGIAPTAGGLVVRNLRVINSSVGGSGAAFQPSGGAMGFTFDTVELDGGDGYAAVLDNNQGVVFRNVYAHSTGQFAINAQEASSGAGGRTTLRLIDTVVSGARAAIHIDDRASVFAENGQLLTNYTGATYKSVGSVLFDVHFNPGGTFYGRNNYMNAATTSGSYAGDTALINTWVADGGTPGDGTDTAAVSAIVEGGYGVASKTAGTLHHFAARPAGSNLRVFGVNHDATKNTGFVQVLDGLVDWANIVNKTNSNVFTNTTLAAGTLTTGERNSTADAILARTNGSVSVGTQLQRVDAPVSSVSGGGASLTDINLEAVPESRTFVLKPSSSGLVSDTKTVSIGATNNKLWAVDFHNDIAVNQYISIAGAPTIMTGTAGGVTFGTPGRSATESKFTMNFVTAGQTYTIKVPVTYRDGSTSEGRIVVKVVP